MKPIVGFSAIVNKSPSNPKGAALVSDIGIVKSNKGKPGSQRGAESIANTAQSSNNNGISSDNAGLNLGQEDSFEKYYNKDLDLEEDQVPIVIYELNESAINFIS